MRGWQALCRMLRKTSCLTYLDARRTLLTDMTMPTFGRCVKADPPLKILHLESVYLSGRPLLILSKWIFTLRREHCQCRNNAVNGHTKAGRD